MDIKVRLHTAINQDDFVSWCMLYTYEGNEMLLWVNREKMTLIFREWTIKSHASGYEIGPIDRSV